MSSRLRFISSVLVGLALIGCHEDPSFQSRSADDWRELLIHGNSADRVRAANAFANAPPHTFANVRVVLGAANDPDPLVRDAGRAAIKSLQPSSIDALIRALDDTSVMIRRRAAAALGQFPASAEQSMGPLTGMLDDADDSVHALAMSSLTTLGAARNPRPKR